MYYKSDLEVSFILNGVAKESGCDRHGNSKPAIHLPYISPDICVMTFQLLLTCTLSYKV